MLIINLIFKRQALLFQLISWMLRILVVANTPHQPQEYLVSMEDAAIVSLVLMCDRLLIQKENVIGWQDLVPSDYYLFDPIKERFKTNIYASEEKVKTALMKWIKEVNRVLQSSDTCSLFEGGTLLLIETVTMLRSRDVIHRGPTSF